MLVIPPASRGRCLLTDLQLLHSHGVIAALLFGFEEAHGQESSGLHAQHQDDASDEAGHVKLGLGELGGRVALTSVA